MDDIEQFSRALNAIAQAGAYSAKDIRQVCTQEVQCEETVLWADNIPYAVIRNNNRVAFEKFRLRTSRM